MPLLRRRAQCFYCNQPSRNTALKPGTRQQWTCDNCQVVNYLDEHGQITDPPLEVVASSPVRPVQYARDRSPSAIPPAESQPVFCQTCQRNQVLVQNLMAEYIPDEDDPSYEENMRTAEDYRLECEMRYPVVCDDCVGQVRDQITAAGYRAKTDQLAKMLERSEKAKKMMYTPRQIWTLRLLGLAKRAYIADVIAGLAWHGVAIASSPNLEDLAGVRLWNGLSSSIDAALVLRVAQAAVSLDFFTLWWNPVLPQKTTRPGGRLYGLISLWFVRLLTLGSRIGLLYVQGTSPSSSSSSSSSDAGHYPFFWWHTLCFLLILASIVTTWRSPRIVYQQTFMQPLDPYLPQVAPNKRPAAPVAKPFKTARPKADVFDTMAQSFTESFNVENPMSDDLPPSPTETETSRAFTETDTLATPYAPSQYNRGGDYMDWTPTRRRFGQEPVDVQPIMFGGINKKKEEEEEEPAVNRAPPVSLLGGRPDPNPFNRRVPPPAKGGIYKRPSPWKAGVWDPPPASTKKLFQEEVLKNGDGGGETEEANVVGVPKSVKKESEFFKKPQFVYDFYGYVGEKTTGLEEGFGGLFTK